MSYYTVTVSETYSLEVIDDDKDGFDLQYIKFGYCANCRY